MDRFPSLQLSIMDFHNGSSTFNFWLDICLTLGFCGLVWNIREVKAIERHAVVITSKYSNHQCNIMAPYTHPAVVISTTKFDKPVTLWSRRKHEYGHLSSSSLTSATTYVNGLSEQTLYSPETYVLHGFLLFLDFLFSLACVGFRLCGSGDRRILMWRGRGSATDILLANGNHASMDQRQSSPFNI